MGETRGNVLLIVEHHPPLRILLHEWLADVFKGCRCLVAGSGQEALHMVAAERPCVVVLDIGRSNLDGIELLRTIKSAAPAIPVVVLSNYDAQAYLIHALREGARAYVPKLRMYSELPPILAKLLGRTRADP